MIAGVVFRPFTVVVLFMITMTIGLKLALNYSLSDLSDAPFTVALISTLIGYMCFILFLN